MFGVYMTWNLNSFCSFEKYLLPASFRKKFEKKMHHPRYTNSIVNWGYQDNFKPVNFLFLRKDLTRTKKQQTQTSDFYAFRVVRAKSCCLCEFLLAYFCFVSWFLHVCVFVRLKFVDKNRLEIALIASITYTTHTILVFLPISPTLFTLVRQLRQPR